MSRKKPPPPRRDRAAEYVERVYVEWALANPGVRFPEAELLLAWRAGYRAGGASAAKDDCPVKPEEKADG